jgi:hypothetical protein
MKTTIITCDICKREILQRGWEDAPQRLTIETNCTSQNPMERITHDSRFQSNTFKAEDVCQSCMKSLARIIADGIESLANA